MLGDTHFWATLLRGTLADFVRRSPLRRAKAEGEGISAISIKALLIKCL